MPWHTGKVLSFHLIIRKKVNMPRGRSLSSIRRINCEDCKVKLDDSNSVWHNPQSRGRRCRPCYLLYMKKRYAEESPEKRRNTVLKRYGTTSQEYDKLLEFQQGGCAICRQPPEEGKNLSVDHNHETNEIRGLLCRNCNLVLGYSKENENILWNTLEYLKRTTWNKKIEVA